MGYKTSYMKDARKVWKSGPKMSDANEKSLTEASKG